MTSETLQLLNDINRSIIQLRGLYSAWSAKHDISYNEMLVLYTIREKGFCTQKQVCEDYLLPRQTINHVIKLMLENGILARDKTKEAGREKAFILTRKGEAHCRSLLDSLNQIEEDAVSLLGAEKIKSFTGLLSEYNAVLSDVIDHAP